VKNRRMNILKSAAISAIAIGFIGLMGGCKSQEILKERPFVPAPSSQEPSNPEIAVPAVPAVITPAAPKPVLPPVEQPIVPK
jgi:hypothetical protein